MRFHPVPRATQVRINSTKKLRRTTKTIQLLEGLERRTLFSGFGSGFTLNTLAIFTPTSGNSPNGDLVVDNSGNLFGTTNGGGTSLNKGSVFEVAAGSGTVSTVAALGGTAGSTPAAGLVADSAGDEFGTTFTGGADSDGTVFEVPKGATAAVPIAQLTATPSSEANPVIIDSSGNVFGTTASSVYEVVNGSGGIATLATFPTSVGGVSGLVMDSSGNLFGTTSAGGSNSAGSIFEVAAVTHALTTVASFSSTLGTTPTAGLAIDSAGNLYGTTSAVGPNGSGTVFELPVGTTTPVVLAAFAATSFINPSKLIIDSAGNLYGETEFGGGDSLGSVFEVAKTQQSVISTLVSFSGASSTTGTSGNGSNPLGGLTLDAAGNLYGTTIGDGISASGVPGTVFELTPAPITAHLAFLAQPTDVTGNDITGPVQVAVVDQNGGIITTDNSTLPNGITLAFSTSPVGATLEPTSTAVAPIVNGVATFSDLSVLTANSGSAAFQATDANDIGQVSPAISNSFAVNPAASLVFAVQPSTAPAGTAISPNVTIDIDDINHHVVTSDNSTVTLTITSGPSTATFGGASGTTTTTASAVNGVATFSNLSISSPGTYTVTATDSDALVPGATSQSFTITTAQTASSETLAPTLTQVVFPKPVMVNGSIEVVQGQKLKGRANVTVTNQTSIVEKGSVTVDVFACPDGVIDSSATLVGTLTRKQNLKPTQVTKATVKLISPLSNTGIYTLLAGTVDPSGNTSDGAPGATPITLFAEPSVVQFSAPTAISIIPGSIAANGSATVAFTITNNGFINSTGTATINIGASSDGVTETVPLDTETKKLTIKPGSSKILKLHFVVGTPTPGTYQPFISFTQDSVNGSGVGTQTFTIS